MEGVFAPTPWPAVTTSMTTAESSIATSAETAATITALFWIFALRSRAARARARADSAYALDSALGSLPKTARGEEPRKEAAGEAACRTTVLSDIDA